MASFSTAAAHASDYVSRLSSSGSRWLEVIIATNDETPRVRLSEVTARLELEYPCHWVYKIIGEDAARLRQAVLQLIEGDAYTVSVSKTSSSGRYVSLNIDVEVRDERERTSIYEALRSHPDVRMVL